MMRGEETEPIAKLTIEDGIGTVSFSVNSFVIDNATPVRNLLIEAANNTDIKKDIVVDMSPLEVIDSTSLGVLIGGLKRARAKEKEITLRHPQEKTLKVLKMTGLTSVFKIEEAAQEDK